MKNEAGTSKLLAIPIICFVISLLVYWVIRSQTNLSMIQRYHKSVTESSANGLTNLSVFMAMIIIYLLVIVGKISKNVSKMHFFSNIVQLLL